MTSHTMVKHMLNLSLYDASTVPTITLKFDETQYYLQVFNFFYRHSC